MSTPVNPFEQDQFAKQYLQRYQDVGQDAYFKQNPFEHYNRYGQNEGRQWGGMMSGPEPPRYPGPLHGDPPPAPPRPAKNSGSSPAGKWYLNENPDVAKEGWDPWEHYQAHGRSEGRKWEPQIGDYVGFGGADDILSPKVSSGRIPSVPPGTGGLSPNPNQPVAPNPPRVPYTEGPGSEPKGTPAGWNAAMYLALNPDVKASGIDPFTHYLMFGKDEGRKYQMGNLDNDPQEPRFTPPPQPATPMGGGNQAAIASQLAGQMGGQGGPNQATLASQLANQSGGPAGAMRGALGQMGGGRATPWDALQRMAAYRGERPAGG